ncbi:MULTISPECIES: polysaccharide biosynthesis/export family protein [Maribacter]|uniref:Polysaccharide export outer membrane protein n=1 Tax=Maribacter stanieri TaxID=440514 RepID=A0A1I6JSX9_9FLAO|nr:MULTISPECIES: polysaccharide biosynthesis/export family protein [Maribacter]SFR82031.1 polysaccharide export outer membrane protein [Maribacter stanieri]|tara:strand:+ start:8682 stop:9458 length:777 start_codon:yes stop_codon:yes gene_type:complete
MNRLSVIKSKTFLFLSTIFLLHSCASHKDVVYFQGVGDYETNVGENNHSQTFKVDDVVSINVSTLDPQASMPFNLVKGMDESSLRAEQLDYIIDKSGNIDFPVVGQVKIAGLTAEKTKELLKEKLSNYLKDPIINIRLKNFTVTILGEVKSPGTYPVIGEQITILEALGLANDLTIKGKRDNVLVIRDFDGTKVYHRINLTSKEALDSPVYYLTQNDVVYVEPNKSAITASSLDNRATILVSIASVLITSSVLILTRN